MTKAPFQPKPRPDSEPRRGKTTPTSEGRESGPGVPVDAALDGVVRLTRVIGAGRDMRRIFDAFADEIARLVPYDRCAFASFNREARDLLLVHVRGQLPHYPDPGDLRPLPSSAAGWVIEHQQPLIHVIGPEDRFLEDAVRRAAAVAEAVLLPVIVDDTTVGVLALSSLRRGVFHADDLWFLETIADHFGVAVAATNLRRDAERRAVQAQCLAEIAGILAGEADPLSVLDAVLTRAAVMLGDVNAVVLREARSARWSLRALRSIAPEALVPMRELIVTATGTMGKGEGVLAPAARGEPVLIRHMQEAAPAAPIDPDAVAVAPRIGARSLLAAPLVAHGEIFGMFVSVVTAEGQGEADPAPLTAHDLHLARELAARLASALENARLHAETRRALDESEALRRIGQELSGSVDQAQVVELVANFARLLLNADYAAVASEEPDGTFAWRAIVGNRTDEHRRTPLVYGHGLVGRSVATRRPVVIQGFPDDPAFPIEEFPVHAAEGMRSALGVPLRIGERSFGALIAGYRQPHDFPAAELRLAEALAAQAAIALENARLFVEAQLAIAQRDQFLSVAAHELRTPLTTLRGRVQLLQRRLGRSVSPDDLDALQVVLRQIDRLNRMVTDLLDVSRVQTGRLPLNREQVDLVALVRRATLDAAEAPNESEIAFSSAVGVLMARVDPWRIEQVVFNLVDNARRFTPPGGHVQVLVGRDGDVARIEVTDDGIGIAPEHLERIFEPFFQVESQPRAGVGLGLAICRQIAQDHGGRLWATSASQGSGSTFTMTLPIGDVE